LARHKNCHNPVEYKSDTGFRFILKNANDWDNEVFRTVIVFDVPVFDF